MMNPLDTAQPAPATPAPASRLLAWRGDLILAGLGAATLLVYALALLWPFPLWELMERQRVAMAQVTGRNLWGVAHYTLALGLPFLLYLVGFWALRRWRVSLATVLVFSALFCAVLLPVYPVTAFDVFGYGAYARVMTEHGANPQVTPPSAYPRDSLLQWGSLNRISKPSPYGPMWAWLAAGPSWLGGESPLRMTLAFKALAIAALLGSGALVYLTVRRRWPEAAAPAAYLLAWNPLAVWVTAGDGHNDIVMMFFLLLGFFFLPKRPALALTAVMVGGLVKFAGLLLLPLLALHLWRRKLPWTALAQALIIAGAVGLIVAIPLWAGFDTYQRVGDQVADRHTLSLAAIATFTLANLGGDPHRTKLAVNTFFYVAFFWFFLWTLWRTGGSLDSLTRNSLWAMFGALLLASFYFRYWYALWPLALAALLPPAEARLRSLFVVLSGSALLAYLFTDYLWVWLGIGLQREALAVIAIFGPPLLAWALLPHGLPLLRWRWDTPQGAAQPPAKSGAARASKFAGIWRELALAWRRASR